MTDLIPIATFNISGVAMSVISGSDLYQSGGWDGSPACARAQQALVGAERRKTGAGHTYIVRADLLAAGIIWAYCESVGSTFIREDDPETRRDGRALLAVAERIEICCLKAGWGKPTRDHGPVPPEGTNPQLWSDGPLALDPDLDAKADAELDSVMAAAQKDMLEALDTVIDTEGDLRRIKAAEPKLMVQLEARHEAERRNAAGEVAVGKVAVATTYPQDAWGGQEKGWIVVEVEAPGGGDPVRARRNTAALRDPKHWSDRLNAYVLVGGAGEPVRTWEDMRLALSGQMQRYLSRFPDPAGLVDDGLAYRTASLIVGDHYKEPGPIFITRTHLLTYLARARARS